MHFHQKLSKKAVLQSGSFYSANSKKNSKIPKPKAHFESEQFKESDRLRGPASFAETTSKEYDRLRSGSFEAPSGSIPNSKTPGPTKLRMRSEGKTLRTKTDIKREIGKKKARESERDKRRVVFLGALFCIAGSAAELSMRKPLSAPLLDPKKRPGSSSKKISSDSDFGNDHKSFNDYKPVPKDGSHLEKPATSYSLQKSSTLKQPRSVSDQNPPSDAHFWGGVNRMSYRINGVASGDSYYLPVDNALKGNVEEFQRNLDRVLKIERDQDRLIALNLLQNMGRKPLSEKALEYVKDMLIPSNSLRCYAIVNAENNEQLAHYGKNFKEPIVDIEYYRIARNQIKNLESLTNNVKFCEIDWKTGKVINQPPNIAVQKIDIKTLSDPHLSRYYSRTQSSVYIHGSLTNNDLGCLLHEVSHGLGLDHNFDNGMPLSTRDCVLSYNPDIPVSSKSGGPRNIKDSELEVLSSECKTLSKHFGPLLASAIQKIYGYANGMPNCTEEINMHPSIITPFDPEVDWLDAFEAGWKVLFGIENKETETVYFGASAREPYYSLVVKNDIMAMLEALKGIETDQNLFHLFHYAHWAMANYNKNYEIPTFGQNIYDAIKSSPNLNLTQLKDIVSRNLPQSMAHQDYHLSDLLSFGQTDYTNIPKSYVMDYIVKGIFGGSMGLISLAVLIGSCCKLCKLCKRNRAMKKANAKRSQDVETSEVYEQSVSDDEKTDSPNLSTKTASDSQQSKPDQDTDQKMEHDAIYKLFQISGQKVKDTEATEEPQRNKYDKKHGHRPSKDKAASVFKTQDRQSGMLKEVYEMFEVNAQKNPQSEATLVMDEKKDSPKAMDDCKQHENPSNSTHKALVHQANRPLPQLKLSKKTETRRTSDNTHTTSSVGFDKQHENPSNSTHKALVHQANRPLPQLKLSKGNQRYMVGPKTQDQFYTRGLSASEPSIEIL